MYELLLHIINPSVFTKRIEKLASAEILFDLPNYLLNNPKLCKVIEGTDSARNVRIGGKAQNR